MNATKEAKAGNMNIRDGLRKIGAAFLSTMIIIINFRGWHMAV